MSKQMMVEFGNVVPGGYGYQCRSFFLDAGGRLAEGPAIRELHY